MNDKAKPGFSQAGLSTQEAEARLRAEGNNELPRQGSRTPLRIALEVLREPMLALLLGAGLVYLLIGEIKDALILLVFASMSIVITVVQESRTERVLEALRDLTSPRALVVRDGQYPDLHDSVAGVKCRAVGNGLGNIGLSSVG